jgi:hypothetical protein
MFYGLHIVVSSQASPIAKLFAGQAISLGKLLFLEGVRVKCRMAQCTLHSLTGEVLRIEAQLPG